MGRFVRNCAPIFVASIEAMADNPANSARFCTSRYKLLMISLPNLHFPRHPDCVYASFNYP